MGSADQLHASLGDRPCGLRLQLGAYLVDYDNFRHVILDGFNHHGMLLGRARYLHAAGTTDCRVWDIAIARDLVRGVDDHNSFPKVVCEDTCDLAQERRLTDARLAEQQHALAFFDEILNDIDCSEDRASNAACHPDDMACPVAHGGDTVEGALDAGAIILTEIPDACDDVVEVLP
jgi:hypothetical protein